MYRIYTHTKPSIHHFAQSDLIKKKKNKNTENGKTVEAGSSAQTIFTSAYYFASSMVFVCCTYDGADGKCMHTIFASLHLWPALMTVTFPQL